MAAKKNDPESVVEATARALAAAEHPETDVGVAAVLLKLAGAIDDIDRNGLNPGGKLDNVSVPTYLKYAEALGMTPAARERVKPKDAPKSGTGGSATMKDEVGEKRTQRGWRSA